MSEEFFASDYVAQAEEFFWRAISTPRLARKATYLKAAARSLEKAIGLAEASPQRHDGESVEHAVRALAQKIRNLQGTVEDMRLRDEANDAGPPQGTQGTDTDVLEPGSELSLTVRGYEVIVRTGPDGTLHLTCPELPQLSVSSPTVTEAISRTEDVINGILAGRVAGFSDTEPKGA